MPANVLPFAASPSPWFTVRNDAGGKGVIDIRGEIGLPKAYEGYGMEASGSVSEFEAALKDLGNVSEIELNIYSPGGQVFAALAMHAILVRHQARVVANIDGFAGSAATILMLAADEIRMPENAYLMIHNASMYVGGDHRDLMAAAEQLRKWSRDIAALYTARIEDNAGGDRAAILADVIAKMDSETWLTGAEAKALGLVETVTGRVELAACMTSPISATSLAALHRERVPEPLRALLFDRAEEIMSTPAPSNTAATSAPVAPAAPVAEVIETPTEPVAPVAAEVVEPAAAPAAEVVAPVAPVIEPPFIDANAAAAAPAALTLEAIQGVVAAAITPLTDRLAAAETALANEQSLRASGVPQNAWGNQAPADIPHGDAPSKPDFANMSAGEKIRLGREKMHPGAGK
jgi:ATP-dependent protease ClpP protease subunit